MAVRGHGRRWIGPNWCRRSRWHLPTALLWGFALGSAGCAIGPYGAIVARYTYTPTAMVAEIYSVGAIYQVIESTAILGVNKSVYVYPATAGLRPSPEWHFGRASLRETAPLCRSSTTFGIEADGTSYRYGIVAGFFSQTISQTLRESGLLRLVYDADHKERTYVDVSGDR